MKSQDIHERMRSQLIAMQKVATEISKISDLDELIHEVVYRISAFAGVPLNSINLHLWDQEKRHLQVRDLNINKKALAFVERGIGRKVLGFIIPEGARENYMIKAVLERKIYESHDVADFARQVANLKMVRMFQRIARIKLAMVIPMLIEDRVLGVFTIGFARSQVEDFERDILQTFANQVALAIENVRLRQRLGEKVVDAENLYQAQVQFLANSSHELKTPLAAIRGTAEMITLVDADVSSQIKSDLRMIVRSADRMTKIVEQLLTLSKYDHGAFVLCKSEVDFVEIVQNEIHNIHALAQKKNISINFSPTGKFFILVDRDRFAEVVQNLLSNAIKYTSAGGRVDIGIETLIKQGRMLVRLSIHDSGIGISKKDLPHIFERFYRAEALPQDRKGDFETSTGLGLAICKSIVEAHGGRIWATSEIGKGSEFLLEV